MSAAKPLSAVAPQKPVELITAEELAERWRIPVSWIRSHTRARTLDEIPCVRFGRYVRFRWGSTELEAWLRSHEKGRPVDSIAVQTR